MSKKNIDNPNAKGSGFLWAVIALLAIIAVVIGFIVIDGKRGKEAELAGSIVDTHINVSVEDGGIRLTSDNTAADAPEVDLYEDYFCPHCAELAEATDEAMLKAVEDGKLVVTIRSLNFLDRGKDGGSTHAAAAAYTLAKAGEARAYWNLRARMLGDQNAVYSWQIGDFATAAEEVGASKESRSAIAEEKNVGELRYNAEANAKKLEDTIGSVSSPHVIKDGKDLLAEGNSSNWVEQATK